MQSAESKHIVREPFVIDQPAAAAACANAQRALQAGDHHKAQNHLIHAIRFRPSCALAYKLLGDLFRACNSDDLAAVCNRNLLPESILT